jgi:hypothetical protein
MSIKGINDGIKIVYPVGSSFQTVSGEGQPQSYFKYFFCASNLFHWRIFLEEKEAKVAR